MERSTFKGGSLKGYGALTFGSIGSMSLEVTSLSNWTISGCKIEGLGGTPAFLFSQFTATFANGSSWIIADCDAMADGAGALLLQSSSVTIANASEARFERNLFTGKGGPSVALVASSRLVVLGLSLWSIVNGSMVGSGAGSVTSSSNSIIVIDGASAVVIQGVTMVGTQGPAVMLGGGAAVSDSSLLMLQRNVLHVSSDHCVDIGLLTITDWGTFRILDNDCTGANDGGGVFLAGRSDTYIESRFPLLVSRCNSVNGMEQKELWKAAGITVGSASSLTCGRCDAVVDCFWPLTSPSFFTRMQCAAGDGEALRCSCMSECGGSPGLCLPGPATLSSSDSCSTNSDHRVRPAMSQSSSVNATLTEELTRTSSNPPFILRRRWKEETATYLTWKPQ